MNIKIVFIILGEPNSIFSEVLFKYFISKKFKKNKKKIILIGSKNLFEKQMELLGYKIMLNKIINVKNSKRKHINIIDVDYKFTKAFKKISTSSTSYIEKCFKVGTKLLKENKFAALINGPISKKHFLKKKISRNNRVCLLSYKFKRSCYVNL